MNRIRRLRSVRHLIIGWVLLCGIALAQRGAVTTEPPAGIEGVSLKPAAQAGVPEHVLRLDYRSGVDGEQDWALVAPRREPGLWVVNLHGYGAHGDQLYTRADLQLWRDAFTSHGLGVLTPNLRNNVWMNTAAVRDLRGLLAWVRERYGATGFLFVSGSMGGTGSLIYATQHPEDVTGLVALCPASDVGVFAQWSREQTAPVVLQIGAAIAAAYGTPDPDAPEFRAHSAVRNVARLTMPVYLVHGTADAIIPVEQSRALAGTLERQWPDGTQFRYVELEGGDHDAPLKKAVDGLAWVLAKIRENAQPE